MRGVVGAVWETAVIPGVRQGRAFATVSSGYAFSSSHIAGEQIDREVIVSRVAAGLYSYFRSMSKKFVNEDRTK